MGNHGYSQVSVSLDGCFVSRGIIVPSLLFVVVLVVSPVRCILSTLVGCFAYPSFSHSPFLEDEKTTCTMLVAE